MTLQAVQQSTEILHGKVGRKSVIIGWLKLVRVPNLFTVPGDVIVGACLAAGEFNNFFSTTTALTIAVSLCLYISGLILNDWFDIETDRVDRPFRPLVSVTVYPPIALLVGVSFIIIALCIAICIGKMTALVAGAIAFAVVFYNWKARKIAILGFIVMALCRGLNVLLGATGTISALGNDVLTAIPSVVIIAAGSIALYIFFVSVIAKNETRGIPNLAMRLSVPVSLAGGLFALNYTVGVSWLGIFSCVAVTFAVANAVLFIAEGKMPERIGRLISYLILVQTVALIVVGHGVSDAVIGVAILFSLANAAGCWFYGS